MKKFLLTINNIVEKPYWLLILALGYLTGYSLFFLIFRSSSSLDFPRYLFLVFIGITVLIYLLVAFFYHENFLKNSYLIILALIIVVLYLIISWGAGILREQLAVVFLAVSMAIYFYPLLIDLRKKIENKKIPENTDYDKIPGLLTESKHKLKQIKPVSVGQASRISGVTPADIGIIMIWLEKRSYTSPKKLDHFYG